MNGAVFYSNRLSKEKRREIEKVADILEITTYELEKISLETKVEISGFSKEKARAILTEIRKTSVGEKKVQKDNVYFHVWEGCNYASYVLLTKASNTKVMSFSEYLEKLIVEMDKLENMKAHFEEVLNIMLVDYVQA